MLITSKVQKKIFALGVLSAYVTSIMVAFVAGVFYILWFLFQSAENFSKGLSEIITTDAWMLILSVGAICAVMASLMSFAIILLIGLPLYFLIFSRIKKKTLPLYAFYGFIVALIASMLILAFGDRVGGISPVDFPLTIGAILFAGPTSAVVFWMVSLREKKHNN